MYEEFKKPGILKHIPLPLIRSLPCIYYYNKFKPKQVTEKVNNFFESNINYLDEVLVYLSNRTDIHQFKEISRSIYRLKKENSPQLSNTIEKLACICECNSDKLKKITKSEKKKLNEIYIKNIIKLLITIIDIQNNQEKLKKLSSVLKNNCNYDVEITNLENSKISDKILASDLILYNSTLNPKIHQLIDSLSSYKKPGIVLVPLFGNTEEDRVALRHGNQLKKKGYHVIIKAFTPIRLFTSIDREYLKFNLSNN